MIVHLIGPGGAGKSTTAPVLAERLDFDCIDLDKEYLKTSQIDKDVEEKGYQYYVRKNVELYLSLTKSLNNTVFATSSGFMTYTREIHPEIVNIHKRILDSEVTVLLMPSFQLEECVQETVSRQLRKLHESKSVAVQSGRITSRFPTYAPMGNIKVSTNESVEKVVSNIVTAMGR